MLQKEVQRIKLNDLCHIVTKGTTPTSVGLAFSDSGIPFLRIQNLSNKTISLKNVLFIDEKTHNSLKRSVIKPRDFLITIAGTIGKVAIVPDEFPESNCNQAIAILRFDNTKLHPEYLFHWLHTQDALQQITGKKVTATISNLSLGQIKNLEIPLPLLAEQKQIAAILDAADSLRQKDQQLIEHYTALSHSLFLEMFGDPVRNPMKWEKKILSDFIQNLNTGVSVNSGDEKYSQDKFGILKTSCVYSGEFRPEEAKVIRGDEFERMKLNPQADSIIISRMNTTELVGKSAYIDQNYPSLFLPDRLWQSEKNKLDHNVRWLAKAISFDSFMHEIGKISSGTSGSMKNISKKNFLNLPLIYPPAELQNQFAERIAMSEQQKQQAQTNLQKSEALFNSLLQRAFTGELTAYKAA